jgi:hypothetical protein
MDSTLITAVAAASGSLVCTAATAVTTWITQRTQTVHAEREGKVRNCESLYGEFISEASRLTVEALGHSLQQADTFVKLYGITGRIRLVATDPVLAAAEACIRQIIDFYAKPNMTVEQTAWPSNGIASTRSGISASPAGRSFSRLPAAADGADLKSCLEADQRLVGLQEGILGMHALLFDLNGLSSAPRAAPAPPERRSWRGASRLFPSSSCPARSATCHTLLPCEQTHPGHLRRHGPCFGGVRANAGKGVSDAADHGP